MKININNLLCVAILINFTAHASQINQKYENNQGSKVEQDNQLFMFKVSAERGIQRLIASYAQEFIIYKTFNVDMYKIKFENNDKAYNFNVNNNDNKLDSINKLTEKEKKQLVDSLIYFASYKERCSLAFSPDGQRRAYGSLNNSIVVIDAKTNMIIKKIEGHLKPVYSIAFSSNSKTMISGSMDNTIKIWDITDINNCCCLQTLLGHNDMVNAITFSADGQHIISKSADNIVKIWKNLGFHLLELN